VAGRLLSVVAGLVSILLTFLLASSLFGCRAGLWAAALVAVSLAHLLASNQVRVDLTMTALVMLAACLAWRGARFWGGLAAGLVVAAKYSAVFVAIPLLGIALWPPRFSRRAASRAALGSLVGLVAGQPYILFRSTGMIQQVKAQWELVQQAPREWRLSPAAFGGPACGARNTLRRWRSRRAAGVLGALEDRTPPVQG
jgi:4-amino-4-deoxy-L-arabinose transferase-like glycosyltransferase